MPRHEGHSTFKRVMWYQDWTFMINDQPDRQLTDEQLLVDWRREFPQADGKVFVGSLDERLTILRAVRAHYNVGRQGHGHRGPAGDLLGGAEKMSLPYDATGQRFSYSDRWLSGISKARPDLRDPR